MTEQAQSSQQQAWASHAPASPAASAPPSAPGATAEDRPELALGAAFAGGLLAALILKRLVR